MSSRYFCWVQTFLFSHLLLAIIYLGWAKEKNFYEAFQPLSNFYVNELLANIERIEPYANQLPDYVHPVIGHIAISPKDFFQDIAWLTEGAICFPWGMITGGISARSMSFEDEEMRLNIMAGNTHSFPWYVRVGCDFLPFGRHYSDILSTRDMISYTTRNDRDTIISTGMNYQTDNDQYQGSLCVGARQKLIILNVQYQQCKKLPQVDNVLIGGGLGLLKNVIHLFNGYAEVNIFKQFCGRGEYLYNNIPLHQGVHPSSLHLEAVYCNKTWKMSYKIVSGYEQGARLQRSTDKKALSLEKNLFLGVKLTGWKNRINVAILLKKSLIKSHLLDGQFEGFSELTFIA